jgi:hypothetical protein
MPASLMFCLLAAASPAVANGPVVREAPIRAHLAFLSNDLLEGRGTGQRGGELAVLYLETQLRALGLAPANGDSFLPRVELVGLTLLIDRSRVFGSGGRGEL